MEEQGQNQNQAPQQPPTEPAYQPEPVKPPEQTTNTAVPVRVEGPQWHYQSGKLAPSTGYDQPAPVAPPQQVPTVEDSAQVVDEDLAAVSWNATEFVNHEKSSIWYVYVLVAAIIVAAIIYLLTRDIFSVVVIVLVAVAFGVFGALKPRVLEYSIGPDGIKVGANIFNYEEFRSFAVIEEGSLPSIQLLPHKRFAVPIVMYFEPTRGDKIINILGEYLPLEHSERDLIDKIASKIHF